MQPVRSLRSIIDELNVYWNSEKYLPLNNKIGSTGYVKQSQSGEVITDEMLEHLHDQVIVRKGLRDNIFSYGYEAADAGEDYFSRWVAWFNEKMWPLLREKARALPGLYHFYLEHGMYSDAVIMFDYDAWTDNLATACLLAHGITHDIDGNLVPVRMDDPMLIYIKENSSLCFMRYRSTMANEEIVELKERVADRKIRIGVFGGGAEPALWLNNLDLDGMEVIIYDTNPKMKGVLEQIMGQPLEELGIDYRTESFLNAFSDESLFGTFDLIVYNGVMSYYPEKKKSIIIGSQRLLGADGKLFFDDILKHPDMVFGLLVRGWTTALKPEESLEVALEKNKEAIAEAGLVYERHECQDVREIHNVLVSWAVKKPA